MVTKTSTVKALGKRSYTVIVGVMVVTGSIFAFKSQAATPFISAEPELGTVTSPATIVTDPTASGGKVIAFGAAQGGIPSDPYPIPTTPAAVMTVTQLAVRFDAVEPSAYTALMGKSVSDSSDIYESGYYWEGYVAAFEATGNTKYLDRMFPSVNKWIDGAKAVPGGYLGWTNDNSDYAGIGGEYPLLESYGWRFVTYMLYAMKKNPTAMANPTYKAQYDKTLAFTEKNIWQKWYSRGIGNLYRQNTHMASHWAGMGMDLALVTNDATLKQQYLTVAKNIMFAGIPSYSNNQMKGQMRPNPNNTAAYWWDENWGSFSTPTDVNHGEAVVTQAIYAYELASRLEASGSTGWTTSGWTAADMTKLKVMFDKIIWTSANGAGFVDGSGTGNGWYDGFVKLGRFDPALQSRLDNAGGRSTSSIWWIGNAMRNAQILRGGVN